jgi:hypothetical protein
MIRPFFSHTFFSNFLSVLAEIMRQFYAPQWPAILNALSCESSGFDGRAYEPCLERYRSEERNRGNFIDPYRVTLSGRAGRPCAKQFAFTEVRHMRYPMALIAALVAILLLTPASRASAQVGVAVNIGPAPVCPYGYFDYAPYSCAPYGS